MVKKCCVICILFALWAMWGRVHQIRIRSARGSVNSWPGEYHWNGHVLLSIICGQRGYWTAQGFTFIVFTHWKLWLPSFRHFLNCWIFKLRRTPTTTAIILPDRVQTCTGIAIFWQSTKLLLLLNIRPSSLSHWVMKTITSSTDQFLLIKIVSFLTTLLFY